MITEFIIVIILIALLITYFFYGPELELKCILVDKEGKKKFCVRRRKNAKEAAELLSKVSDRCQKVVDTLAKSYASDERYQRLKSQFRKDKMMENLPTSELTAYTQNKGEKMAFCLNENKQDDERLIDEETLFFVALHELSHVATKENGHEPPFWGNFKDLLEKAQQEGLYVPVNYKIEPKKYCSMKITHNPYYDKKE